MARYTICPSCPSSDTERRRVPMRRVQVSRGANHVNHASEERMASTWATVYPRKSPTKCSQPEDMPWDNVLALTAPQIEMKVHWQSIFTSHEERGRAEDAWQCNAYQDHVPTSSKYLSR